MRRGMGTALAFVAMIQTVGLADEPDPVSWTQKNQVSFRFYQDTRGGAFEDLQAMDCRARTENKLDIPASQATVVLNGEARVEAFDVRDEYAGEFLLREAYVEIRRLTHTIAFGNQVVTWGKLDSLCILDIVNPQDYRWFVLPALQDRKEPVVMLRDLYAPSDTFQVELLLLPVFQPARFDYFGGGDWTLFGRLQDVASQPAIPASLRQDVQNLRIEEDPSVAGGKLSAEAALRVKETSGSVDYGVYYMNLHNRVPSFRSLTPMGDAVKRALLDPAPATVGPLLNATLTPDDLTLEEVYTRGHVAGLDVETVFGGFGLRGEAAYFTDQPFLNEDDFSCTTRNTCTVGLGIDRSMADDFYWNLQVMEGFVPNADQELFATRTVSQQVAVNLRKDLLMGELRLSIGGLWRISYADGMLHPEARYRCSDALELAIGGFWFMGDDSSDLFGRYDGKGTIYTEARYRF